ncbi:helix-turn-helix domain-containing protein [Thiothrix litoralis]|uniref:Helix-turn-helix domain-containing protein n=1 Tax=Thiothrix litoralis TaxID=2891210 RepID=A0ABX7WQA9_9GAMM|nr:helix-turn-helix domain-containing protein [Thiothrix litoralis]QTR45396.1 helix-turn-helix domain-containing protein [Thiothrix litoralis]
MQNPEIMTTDDAAAYLSVNKRKLQLDRVTKRAIPFIKIGRLVRYSKADLDAYISAQTVGKTA